MSLIRKFRNSRVRVRQGVAFFALSAIIGLCVVRVVSPGAAFPKGQSTVTSAAGDGHHLYLDHDGLEWVRPTPTFSIYLPERVVFHRRASSEARSAFEANGVHYDRPPPSA